MVDKKDDTSDKITPIRNEGSTVVDDSLDPIGEHIEEVSVDGHKVRHRGVYLLPNLFTTAALF